MGEASVDARPLSAPLEVSIFDLDGTLSRRDTFLAFLMFCLVRRVRRWPRMALLAFGVGLHFLGRRSNTWLKVWFLRHILGGAKRATVEAWSERFARLVVAKEVRADGLAAMRRERERGRRLVLATASPDLYVIPLAKALGFESVLCTHVTWTQDDCCVGELRDGNCYGPGKVAKVRELLAGNPALRLAAAFSDHHSDIELLTMAQEPRAVNPGRKLAAEASKRGFEIVCWN